MSSSKQKDCVFCNWCKYKVEMQWWRRVNQIDCFLHHCYSWNLQRDPLNFKITMLIQMSELDFQTPSDNQGIKKVPSCLFPSFTSLLPSGFIIHFACRVDFVGLPWLSFCPLMLVWRRIDGCPDKRWIKSVFLLASSKRIWNFSNSLNLKCYNDESWVYQFS